MKSGHIRSYFVSALLMLALMVTSCSKEELVEPCQKDTAGDAKNFTTSQDATDWNGSASPRGGDDPDDDGGIEIGDDGDDLSDSERNRKKKAN